MNRLTTSNKSSLFEIFKRHKCEFVYLTGSYARKEQFSWSDIDFVISYPDYNKLSTQARLHYLLNITTAIADTLKFDNIDIKIIETLPLHIQFSMIRDGILIYEVDEDRRTDFIEKLLKVYYDHAIWYENYLDMALSED